MSKDKPGISMTRVTCVSKLRVVVIRSMPPCPGNWMSIGRAVVYYARAAHAVCVGIKCWHCMYQQSSLKVEKCSEVTYYQTVDIWK